MKIASSQTRWLAHQSTRKVLRRACSTAAVLAVSAAAIGVPVMSPEPDSGTSPVLAIARADCPPDCGGGPGNGGMPSGPPGGGTEFVPPSIPAMPSYDPGRGQPPLDQNNGISIYNSASPQPSQAAQPSQAPVQNHDGTYNRAANGEQQPINHSAPSNQQLNNNWQQLRDQLNNQAQRQSGQQSGQDSVGQQDQTQNNQQDKKQTCESIAAIGADLPPLETALHGGSVDPDYLAQAAKIAQRMQDAMNAAHLTPEQCEKTNAAQCGEPSGGPPIGLDPSGIREDDSTVGGIRRTARYIPSTDTVHITLYPSLDPTSIKTDDQKIGDDGSVSFDENWPLKNAGPDPKTGQPASACYKGKFVLKGPAYFCLPVDPTEDEKIEFDNFLKAANDSLNAGLVNPEGRRPLTPAEVTAAENAATAEGDRPDAKDAFGVPYRDAQGKRIKAVGHAPDRTWLVGASPDKWVAMTPRLNSSIAGQNNRFRRGFIPTKFVAGVGTTPGNCSAPIS